MDPNQWTIRTQNLKEYSRSKNKENKTKEQKETCRTSTSWI